MPLRQDILFEAPEISAHRYTTAVVSRGTRCCVACDQAVGCKPVPACPSDMSGFLRLHQDRQDGMNTQGSTGALRWKQGGLPPPPPACLPLQKFYLQKTPRKIPAQAKRLQSTNFEGERTWEKYSCTTSTVVPQTPSPPAPTTLAAATIPTLPLLRRSSRRRPAQAVAADRRVGPHDEDGHQGKVPAGVFRQSCGRGCRHGDGCEHDVAGVGEGEAQRGRAGNGQQEAVQEPPDFHRSR